jgi:hypothetical protein
LAAAAAGAAQASSADQPAAAAGGDPAVITVAAGVATASEVEEGISMGVAVALMVVCLFIGFLLGTRGRQIVAAVKKLPAAIRALSFKIPLEAPDPAAGQQANNDDGGENDEREDEEEPDVNVNIDDLIQPMEADPALSDHPDVLINPVVMYQIKVAKEEMRAQQRRASLLAEGFDASEVDERMSIEQTSGGGGKGRPNALALLISIGARVEATAGGSSQEAAQLQERRRLQRNVDAYLLKSVGVEKFRADGRPASRDPVSGGRRKTAHEVAKETTSYGGERHKRKVANVRVARDARMLYRKWKRTHGDGGRRNSDFRAKTSAITEGTDALSELQKEAAAEQGEAAEDEDDEVEEGEEGDEDENEDEDEEEGEEGNLDA